MQKIALITGASRGIGAATAHLLASRGYAVAVNFNTTEERAQKVAEGIIAKGGKAIVVQANMGDEAAITGLFDEIDKKLGPLTALVNNAAINPSGKVEDMPMDVVEQIFAVNALGVFAACREAAKRMKKSGGAIVNVSSEAAKFGGNAMAHYAASKAAVNTFTTGFAREVAAYNIRVNVVSPGIIDTEAHQAVTPEKLTAMKTSLPMGRMGKPEEVAATIAWLLSDEASYVSGSILTVAGAR